jgi:alpha 1,2-mannosyltransferase
VGVTKTVEVNESGRILPPDVFQQPEPELPPTLLSDYYKRRANATFVMLCRNIDLHGVISSIQQVQDRFNRDYKYPWVLLNDEPFTEEFKR